VHSKKQTKGLGKGGENMQDLTSICGSAFLQNHQMLKYKKE